MGAGDGRHALIDCRGVVKRYDSATTSTLAIEHLDIAFYEGEITLLIGPSGCGKTTLLNMVAGFETPTEGEILAHGAPVTVPHPRRGVIFQDPTLFPWLSVWDNVTFGPRVRGTDTADYEARAAELLEMVGLVPFKDHKPYQLSGGMRHRVAIIRTLANDPEILLADEPFTALDEHNRRKLQADFLRIVAATKKTVIFVTHNIEEAIFLADRIVVMSPSPGRIKEIIETVDLERPRDILSSAFNEYRSLLYNLITPEVAES